MADINYTFNLFSDDVKQALVTFYAYRVGAFNYNWHRAIECMTVLEGTVEVTVDGKNYLLEQDDICFIDSIEGHATLNRSEESAVVVIHIAPQVMKMFFRESDLLRFSGTTSGLSKYRGSFNSIRNGIIQLVESFEYPNYISNLSRTTAFLTILFHSVNHFTSLQKSEGLKSEKIQDIEIVKEILDYLNENYREKIYLHDLAKLVGYHPNYVSEMFSTYMGIPFTEYLQRRRLSLATKDLKLSDILISEIALKHGFTNIKAFNTAFKEAFRRTPSEYRASLDEGTRLIDATFKKVFIDSDERVWQDARRRWMLNSGDGQEDKLASMNKVARLQQMDEVLESLVKMRNKLS